MSRTSQHPTFSASVSATVLSRAIPYHSIISLKDPKTNTQGPEWGFDRVNGTAGPVYLPHGPVNPSQTPEDLPLTAASPFFPNVLRKYIAKHQTQYSKDASDWYLSKIEAQRPQCEGVAEEDAVHLKFEVPLAEGPFWRARSQVRYWGKLTMEVLNKPFAQSEGTSRPDSVS